MAEWLDDKSTGCPVSKRLIAVLSTILLVACSESASRQSAEAQDVNRHELLTEAEAAVAAANTASASSGTKDTPPPQLHPETEEPATPPPEHTLRVIVLDASSHQPVEGVILDVADQRDPRRVHSDTSGTALIDSRGLPPTGNIAIHCPGHGQDPLLPQRTLAPDQSYQLVAGKGDLVVHVDLARCDIPKPLSRKVRMLGMYLRGFEASTFYPCDGFPPESEGFEFPAPIAWVEFERKAEEDMAFGAWLERAFGDGILYADWTGVLHGPGSYGHLGMSLYEMRVETVHDTRMSRPSDCKAPGFEEGMRR